jgi:hypothetical protein
LVFRERHRDSEGDAFTSWIKCRNSRRSGSSRARSLTGRMSGTGSRRSCLIEAIPAQTQYDALSLLIGLTMPAMTLPIT